MFRSPPIQVNRRTQPMEAPRVRPRFLDAAADGEARDYHAERESYADAQSDEPDDAWGEESVTPHRFGTRRTACVPDIDRKKVGLACRPSLQVPSSSRSRPLVILPLQPVRPPFPNTARRARDHRSPHRSLQDAPRRESHCHRRSGYDNRRRSMPLILRCTAQHLARRAGPRSNEAPCHHEVHRFERPLHRAAEPGGSTQAPPRRPRLPPRRPLPWPKHLETDRQTPRIVRPPVRPESAEASTRLPGSATDFASDAKGDLDDESETTPPAPERWFLPRRKAGTARRRQRT